MNQNRMESKPNTALLFLRVAAYLLAVLLVLLTFAVLCAEDAVRIEPAEEPGVTDLRDFDFANDIAKVAVGWESVYMYPGAFYMSEDFAEERVTQAGSLTMPKGDFGTMRMILLLPPGEIYAISAKSISYAQRMFVDGKEIGTVGTPAQTMEELTPSNRRYIEGFYAQGESTEIIFHYSVMVHADGGGLYPMLVGSVAKVARAEQLRTLLEGVQAAALLTALLFFFGLFLFFPVRRYLLWFALLCGCIAVQLLGANNNAIMLLLPEVSFTLYLRLSYLATCCIGLTSALYINGLFPGAANKWAMRGFAVYCAAVCIFLCLAPTTVFTRFPVLLSGSYVAFLAYLLTAILVATLRRRLRFRQKPAAMSGGQGWGDAISVLTKTEGFLLLAGMGLYIAFSGVAVWAHQHSWNFFGWEFQAVGIMVFLFLNVLALTLVFSRTERELDDARQSEREMEETNHMLRRLNHIRTAFLQNITHEMKTPLTGIKALAQVVEIELSEVDGVDAATGQKLDAIVDRAERLSDYVDRLLEQSTRQEDKLDFAAVAVHTLFAQTAALTMPLLRERGNRLTCEAAPGLPPLACVEEMLVQALQNLITNANRHCRNSEIQLTATVKDHMAEIRVTDYGDGIPDELLPRVFQRGISGDGSTGLGLPNCKEIVDTHGGVIYIHSQPEQGTQVWFTVPLAKEDALQ